MPERLYQTLESVGLRLGGDFAPLEVRAPPPLSILLAFRIKVHRGFPVSIFQPRLSQYAREPPHPSLPGLLIRACDSRCSVFTGVFSSGLSSIFQTRRSPARRARRYPFFQLTQKNRQGFSRPVVNIMKEQNSFLLGFETAQRQSCHLLGRDERPVAAMGRQSSRCLSLKNAPHVLRPRLRHRNRENERKERPRSCRQEPALRRRARREIPF